MNAKKKKQSIRAYENGTGGGPPCETKLNNFDEQILNIIGEFCADGDPNLGEIGFSSSSQVPTTSTMALNRIDDPNDSNVGGEQGGEFNL